MSFDKICEYLACGAHINPHGKFLIKSPRKKMLPQFLRNLPGYNNSYRHLGDIGRGPTKNFRARQRMHFYTCERYAHAQRNKHVNGIRVVWQNDSWVICMPENESLAPGTINSLAIGHLSYTQLLSWKRSIPLKTGVTKGIISCHAKK